MPLRPEGDAQAASSRPAQFVIDLTLFQFFRSKGRNVFSWTSWESHDRACSAETRIGVSAHNVANLLTGDFRPQRATQTSLSSGGSRAHIDQTTKPAPVQLEREVVDQIEARTQYTASARVFQVGAELSGTLLDILA